MLVSDGKAIYLEWIRLVSLRLSYDGHHLTKENLLVDQKQMNK